MADQDDTPVFQIQRMYLKDLSLEQPNSPQILLEQQQPQVDINLAMAAGGVADGIFEVTVTATVTTKIKDKTCSWSRPSRPASSRSATCRKSSCRAS
jgi:preprotein translocase subunit SecB